ncbi:hypothetical protein HUK80_16395 [Flavobacterium sp. MAH-1]|uniref:DUF6265 domain-containing protein n=1 Tax=Flavobacterium agri TaxID=2743471 RepID=A0A7Y9C6L3_9FLAO|nr:DUF6265 family protein [Flavobacterium agri]NUY82487.1 hypothetical protein [Flavobacterium agri]NYA72511.1 hypothetical protein [Flavobacterium agri]
MKKITLTLMTLAILGCSDKKKETEPASEAKTSVASNLDDAKWLLGKWQDVSEEGTLTETWTPESDSSYAATSFFITGKDTAFAETVRLSHRDGNLIYIVTTKSQNDEKPVEFALTSVSDKQLVFENPKHDYPTKITYENYGDSMKAWISGKKLGVENKEEFPMKKVK